MRGKTPVMVRNGSKSFKTAEKLFYFFAVVCQGLKPVHSGPAERGVFHRMEQEVWEGDGLHAFV